jgi:hypothetical protein
MTKFDGAKDKASPRLHTDHEHAHAFAFRNLVRASSASTLAGKLGAAEIFGSGSI